ncbi:MAG TPA: biofilm-associated protein, partial [Candidatus Nitrosotenuis sp.]|nr:biofilm-associated protein [Candidatus Nitrosotenuis sp.]
MSFNGTAAGGKPIEVVIKDPIGKEVFSDAIPVDDSGLISFKFATDATSAKGTYVVLVSQGSDTAIVRVGLGEPPQLSIVVKFDKLNYNTSDKAKMTISGPANVNVSILILDPSDKPKGPSDYVKLGQDGKRDYEIDLSDYKSGVYSAVLKYQKFQIDEVFTVGLQSGAAGEIKMQATKQAYKPGNAILVLGSAKPNSLLTLKFSDPSGATVRHKDVFTDKNGKFTDSTFRVPADGINGIWTVRAESGANYVDVPINVVSTADKAFTVITDKTTYVAKDIIKISGSGGGKSQAVEVTISDSGGKTVVVLNTDTTSGGDFRVDWITPSDIAAGQYKASVKTGSSTEELTFTIK